MTVGRELARDERKGIRRLVTGWCANYDSGEDICLPLDGSCYMLGKGWTGSFCRYFRGSVLPLDPVLEKAVCEEGPPQEPGAHEEETRKTRAGLLRFGPAESP